MNASAKDILHSALSLEPSERAEIAASLIASLDTRKDTDVNAAWADEIKRRVDSIDNGEVELVPADEVLRVMRARLNG